MLFFSFSHNVLRVVKVGIVWYKVNDPKKGAFLKNTVGINPFPNKPWFLHVCSIYILKTLWKKEKLFIMNNFSYTLSVFYQLG